MSRAPLYGLVLAGGASTRMQRDKAALTYHDRPQLELSFELLQQACEQAFISVRRAQTHEASRARHPQIVDRLDDFGPLGGIAAAQSAHPQAAWLVLACDLPFVTSELIDALIRQRDPAAAATAFRSAHDGLPEPLCAIWEPASVASVQAWTVQDKRCPRKLLATIDATLLDLPRPTDLDNINTPAERALALRELSKATDRKTG